MLNDLLTCRVLQPVGNKVRAEFSLADGVVSPYLQCDSHELKIGGECLLASVLLIAMAEHRKLVISEPVDSVLLQNVKTIQEIFNKWSDELSMVEIEAPEHQLSAPEQGRVGSFFSGGVDSFYTALEHLEEIDSLIFVHGFDVRLDDEAGHKERLSKLKAAASELGKELIEIKTDLREGFSNGRSNWELYHGPALAAVAFSMAHYFRKIYIPSTHTYASLFPWGSHPLVDPLWSTSHLEFVHDGCGAERVDKTERIAKNDVALKYLHVCWENSASRNCGRCEKCFRTMMGLRAVGALDRCDAFCVPLNLQRARLMDMSSENARSFVAENLRYVEDHCDDPELLAVLQDLHSGRFTRGFWQVGRKIVRRLKQLKT